MASPNSPICFRLTPEERALIEAVAIGNGLTISEFIRFCVRTAVNDILSQQGTEVVLEACQAKLAADADAQRRKNEQVQKTLAAIASESK